MLSTVSPSNFLLHRLSDSAREALGPMELVPLALYDSFEKAGAPIAAAYFPVSGVASAVTSLNGKDSIEIGLIGREGVTGLGLVLGDSVSAFDIFAQGEGHAFRVETPAMLAACAASAELRELLQRYVRAFMVQVSTTAASNASVQLEAKLSRWLLMLSDRQGLRFSITHEFLGQMLGCRRSGVTLALQILEGVGLIRSTRGNVAILDRDGLIEHARGSYGVAELHYARLIGDLHTGAQAELSG
jgi:CRP-like cAMP-binding protein